MEPRPASNRLRLVAELSLLLLAPVVLAWLVFTPGYTPDPDAGFHVGCARLYATQGWISSFPWLGFTALGPHFPNVYLLQHVLLAPIAAAFEPETAVLVSTVALGTALVLSLWLVLRRQGVRGAALWAVLGLFASPYSVVYLTSLKGGSTFYVLLPWFADALWSRAVRRTFLLAWLSVYVYVGAMILVPMAVVLVLVVGVWERTWPWRLIAATLAGIGCGMLVNPFWPDHWSHTLHELGSVFLRTVPEIEALRGAEWMSIDARLIANLAGPLLAAWIACLILHLRQGERTRPGAAAGAVVALGLFGASLLGGPKILYLFLLASAVFLPLLARELAWPRWSVVALVLLAGLNAARNVRMRFQERSSFPPLSEYRALAKFLEGETAEGELVLTPWDDFCGLFLFDRRNTYAAGFNVEFLHRTDPQRFRAYAALYEGEVEVIDKTVERRFPGTRVIVTRRLPRRPGEQTLNERLARDQIEFLSPAKTWRVFRLRDAPAARPQSDGGPGEGR